MHTLNSKYRFKNTLWDLVTQLSKENRLVAIKGDKNQNEFLYKKLFESIKFPVICFTVRNI